MNEELLRTRGRKGHYILKTQGEKRPHPPGRSRKDNQLTAVIVRDITPDKVRKLLVRAFLRMPVGQRKLTLYEAEKLLREDASIRIHPGTITAAVELVPEGALQLLREMGITIIAMN
jgi:hypothetical protein